MLSKKAILEYQQIYREEYGKEITNEKTVEGGIKLLRLIKIIYQPIPKTWMKELRKKDKKV